MVVGENIGTPVDYQKKMPTEFGRKPSMIWQMIFKTFTGLLILFDRITPQRCERGSNGLKSGFMGQLLS